MQRSNDMAFQSYQKWAKMNGQEPNLPGYRMTNEQMFWVARHLKTCLKPRALRPSTFDHINPRVWSPGGLRETFGCMGPYNHYDDTEHFIYYDWDNYLDNEVKNFGNHDYTYPKETENDSDNDLNYDTKYDGDDDVDTDETGNNDDEL